MLQNLEETKEKLVLRWILLILFFLSLFLFFFFLLFVSFFFLSIKISSTLNKRIKNLYFDNVIPLSFYDILEFFLKRYRHEFLPLKVKLSYVVPSRVSVAKTPYYLRGEHEIYESLNW